MSQSSPTLPNRVLGADVGGSSIKIGLVDPVTGKIDGDTEQVTTPSPATPEAVIGQIRAAADRRSWTGPVGVAVPAVVRRGVTSTAANIDPSWIGAPVAELCRRELHPSATVLNDADAAGVAELRHGAAKGVEGTCLILTLGTGIGSALFVDGILIPNTELGHLSLHGDSAEKWTAASVKTKENLSFPDWAARLNHYLEHVVRILNPDVLVLGGGISKDADQWLPLLDLPVEVRIAGLLNDAGLIGAALAVTDPASLAGHDLQLTAGQH